SVKTAIKRSRPAPGRLGPPGPPKRRSRAASAARGGRLVCARTPGGNNTALTQSHSATKWENRVFIFNSFHPFRAVKSSDENQPHGVTNGGRLGPRDSQ